MKKFNNTVVIRREKESDYSKVEEVVRKSFMNVYRPGRWNITFYTVFAILRILLKN